MKNNKKTVEELTDKEKESLKSVLYDYSWDYLTKLEGIELKIPTLSDISFEGK